MSNPSATESNTALNTGELSFEQAIDQLGQLVEKLESGELPLEESVAAFEQAVTLSRRCESLLDQAEQRLQVLGEREAGE